MLSIIMNFGGQSSSSTSSGHVNYTPSSQSGNSWATDHMQTNNVVKKRKAGRKKFQETRHPVYKGVRQRNGKWVCELRQPNKKSRVWVGTFPCPDMAARAYDVAALALKGESASLNFPDDVNAIPRIQSLSSIRDIQCTAAETAEAFAEVKETTSSSTSTSSSAAWFSMESLEVEMGATRKVYMDEDELFNMPALLNSMAEGLILTPPAMKKEFDWDDLEETVDFSLWSD
ncbi:dehydration-responsive element-binding protein 1B [Ziziphus jujuba]|uniref:Dehydration-responsive element-binding protein 1B n=2 Tax=Ziziphus jujuba TaxID=326968 RepID=A0A6P4AWU6_ZIZJJ|nr:dehydration-responsive element-binding protein 1B [Ziziphus jujuba]KAH7512118.1 hypothetical protein FEM48_Zijuj12G0056700 [Ziziphus jujuba var. spinosa]